LIELRRPILAIGCIENAVSNPALSPGISGSMKRFIYLLALLAPSLAGGQTVEEIQFESHGARLAGSIEIPANGRIRAAVVFIHGSGPQTRNMTWAQRFASEGIAALVYDKRGAGNSGGDYEGNQSVSEKNISLLADDAVAAIRVLAAHPGLKGVPLGFAGISQAGWIAPLAAQRFSQARFLVLWSGPVCKVSEEDIYSKYTRDAGGEKVPTYAEALNSRTEKYVWPDFLGRDTDAGEDLDRLSIPGLWIFSDNDGSVPVDLSITRLHALNQKGHVFDHVLLPGLGHNNMEGSFAVATDWIKRELN
jgi:pimeloyl-ACP methyl ester carboxylesterase